MTRPHSRENNVLMFSLMLGQNHSLISYRGLHCVFVNLRSWCQFLVSFMLAKALLQKKTITFQLWTKQTSEISLTCKHSMVNYYWNVKHFSKMDDFTFAFKVLILKFLDANFKVSQGPCETLFSNYCFWLTYFKTRTISTEEGPHSLKWWSWTV